MELLLSDSAAGRWCNSINDVTMILDKKISGVLLVLLSVSCFVIFSSIVAIDYSAGNNFMVVRTYLFLLITKTF